MYIFTTSTARKVHKPLLKTLVVILAMLVSNVLQAREYASASAMKEGKWVKITVKEEGMQILTPAALKTMGFSDPSKVHVYGYGGHRLSETLDDSTPDDLPLQPVVRTADGSIIFYGAGLVNWFSTSSAFGYAHHTNFYSTTATYFLSDRSDSDIAPKAINPSIQAGASTVAEFTELLVHEQDIAAAGPSGADMLGEDFRTTSQRSFSFPLTDPVGDNVKFCTVFATNTSVRSKLTLSASGSILSQKTLTLTSSSDRYVAMDYFVQTAPMPSEHKIDLTLKFTGAGVIKTARLDYILAAYQRRLKLSDGILQFRHKATGNQMLQVEGCSQNTLIWDVTDPAAPCPVNYELRGTTACFAPTSGSILRTYIAFNPASVKLAPASAGSVSNQDIHSMDVPHMVIISPDAFKTQAERLAQFHRDHDDMDVIVLSPEAIYNEFASGKPDVTAYRKMLKMFYDRGLANPEGNQLQHCLLFGRPSYDHRLITDVPRNAGYPRVLTWQSYMKSLYLAGNNSSQVLGEDSPTSFCTDNYIACLADNTSTFDLSTAKMSIGVGRMPVKSLQEAKTAVDKLIAYVTDPDYGAWRSHIMLIADDADYGEHLTQMQKFHANINDANYGNCRDFITERLYLDSYPVGTGGNGKTFPQAKDRMFKLLDEGVSFLGYVGHANPTSWTHEGLMTYTDITSMNNRHLPVIYHASCEFVRFDSDTQSGAEIMWLNPTAGAIAFIAANRKILINYNYDMCNALGKNIYARDADGNPRTLGEIYFKTINTIGNQNNKHCFTIMGDPAMRMPSPMRRVKVETIDDTDLRLAALSGERPIVPARSQMKIAGKICLPDGSVDTEFNGIVTATLFDAERVIETYGHPSASNKNDGKVSIYNDRKNRLSVSSFIVKDGAWETTLFLPEEIDNNYSPAFLALYANTPEGTEAMGSTTDFYVYGYDDSLPEDTEAPEIESIALGSQLFRPGDTVSSSTTFLATVRDESGINISSAGIGKQMMIIIDGRKVYDDLADYFMTDPGDPTGGSVTYPLSDLADGEHELTFQVFDNAGNCAKESITFKVGANALTPDLELRTDASPASVEANIFITTSSLPGEAVVEIYDMAGRMVWSAMPEQLAQSMSVKWDLTDKGGNRVPRGIYLYRATVTDASGNMHRRTRKIAVTAE